MDPASVSIDNTTMMESMEYEQPSFSTMDDGDELGDGGGSVAEHQQNNPHGQDQPQDNVENPYDSTIVQTGKQLETILHTIKDATTRLFEEFQTYVETTSGVMNDYARCQESQSKEAQRLAEVSPDVEGATNRFLQEQLAMVGGGTAGGDLAAMLSGQGN